MSQGLRAKFYKSQQWKRCRAAFFKYKGGLCERCLNKMPPEYHPGEIVHHKIYLTDDNLYDLDISLDFDNLELLCRKCHAEEHSATDDTKRWKVDDNENLVIFER